MARQSQCRKMRQDVFKYFLAMLDTIRDSSRQVVDALVSHADALSHAHLKTPVVVISAELPHTM